MRVSIIITGEEMEVDKVIQENSIRKELGMIDISSKTPGWDKKENPGHGYQDIRLRGLENVT